MPWRWCVQALIHILNVFYAFGVHPIFEGLAPLLGINRDAVFPGGASAEHSGELHARLGYQLQRLGELGIAHPGGKINEGLALGFSRRPGKIIWFLLAVSLVA